MSAAAARSFVVTVSRRASSDLEARARRVAEACGLPFETRSGAVQPRAVVVEREGAHLVVDERRMDSHPGIGLVRVRRLQKGNESDPLVELAGLRPGDRVLDATFGFGQDALVCAHAVGDEGRVDAFEASAPLAALAMAGMPHWPSPAPPLARRISLTWGDARQALSLLPDRSYDVVCFDPMFRRPQSAQPDFELLRLLAEHAPLSPESLLEARRVARRAVIVKDGWQAPELQRLGLVARKARPRPEVTFGVLDVDPG